MRPNSTSGSQTQREASSHPSPRESSRTEPQCALRLSNLGQTARLKHRLRNSNSSNDKCMAARKSTFSKHDCSGLRDQRRCHLICVRPNLERLFTLERFSRKAAEAGLFLIRSTAWPLFLLSIDRLLPVSIIFSNLTFVVCQ